MKKAHHIIVLCFLIVLLAPFPIAAAARFEAGEKPDLIKLQREYFKAIKDRKYDVASAFLANGYVGVYSDGIIDREHEIKDLNHFPLTEYQITNEKVAFPNDLAGIVTFRLHVKVTVDGKDFFEDDNIACVWTRQGKKWLMSSQAAVKVRTPSE